MFENKKYLLKELLYENYSDLDILREKPMVFKSGKYFIIINPVNCNKHPLFLKQMAKLILEYYEIFANLEFLTAFNFREENTVKDLITKVTIFKSDKLYKSFIRDINKFIREWAFYAKKKRDKILLKSIRWKWNKIIKNLKADEIIYILFILFVYNYDIVKKNCLEFLKMFNLQSEKKKSSRQSNILNQQADRVIIPKYSKKPFSKETLKIFVEQSKMH